MSKITSLKDITGEEAAAELFEYFLAQTTYSAADDPDGSDRKNCEDIFMAGFSAAMVMVRRLAAMPSPHGVEHMQRLSAEMLAHGQACLVPRPGV